MEKQYIPLQSSSVSFRKELEMMTHGGFWFNSDALVYIALYITMRDGDCELRMASMKLMALVFTALSDLRI